MIAPEQEKCYDACRWVFVDPPIERYTLSWNPTDPMEEGKFVENVTVY